jgi:nitrate reductase cytochrome c-type subunit
MKVILVLLCALLTGCGADPVDSNLVPLADRFDPAVQNYAFVLPNLEPVDGVGGVKASDCGQCHQSVYQEWSRTTHASALRDIQYQSELTKAESPKWICLNCHIPVQNQRKTIVTHLEDGDLLRPVGRTNPDFDREMQQEGVTCAACHVRRDPASGQSYVVGPNGSLNAPHPVKQDGQFLRNVCQRCHNPQGEGLTRNLVCWFETLDEAQEGQPALMETFGKASDCVDCHMPTTNRHVADTFSDLPTKTTRQHQWVGGGVPKWYDGYDTLLERGYETGLGVQVGILTTLQGGAEAQVDIELSNRSAGHFLPTADPERFILVVAALEDREGEALDTKTNRIGQTWEWNPARKVGDNRLRQGESRTWTVPFTLPDRTDGLRLVVTAYHVRLSSNNAQYVMAADSVDESLLENGQYLVAHAVDHYPFASFIFREEVALGTSQRRRYTPAELVELSKLEQGKPLGARAY